MWSIDAISAFFRHLVHNTLFKYISLYEKNFLLLFQLFVLSLLTMQAQDGANQPPMASADEFLEICGKKVTNTNANNILGDNARYNLNGQKVDHTYKGIVIEQGKKSLVK